MSLAQRVLLTWLFTLVFLILLVLKLDGKVHWNWFLIFLPVWLFDLILLLMLAIKVVGRCRVVRDLRHEAPDLRKKLWYLIALLLKLGFCMSLCARLQQLINLQVVYICIPFWVLLSGAMMELGANIFPQQRI